MHYFILLVAVLFVATAQTSVLKLPLRLHASEDDALSAIQKRSQQIALNGESKDIKAASSYPTQIIDIFSIFYAMLTDIYIGTPPQKFRVIVSLFARDIFVLSDQTRSDTEDWNERRYDHDISSTYTSNGTELNATFIYSKARGYASQDTISLGGVSISDQIFTEAMHSHLTMIHPDVLLEGCLGLGSKSGRSASGVKNIVESMYEQNFIDHNTFTITTPSHKNGEGEISFGRPNSKIHMLPISNKTIDLAPDDQTSAWALKINEIRLGDGLLINHTFSNSIAVLEVESPTLFLPEILVNQLNALIFDREIYPVPWHFVPCSVRDWLPDLVFRFEEGVEVRVSPWDYIGARGAGGIERCLILYGALSVESDVVVLGYPFLNAVETHFDLERNMVGFVERGLGPRK